MGSLQVVPHQLRLFAPKMDPDIPADSAGRSGKQWLASVVAYLEFQGGFSWRSRFDPVRREYLDSIRLIHRLENGLAVKPVVGATLERKPPETAKPVNPLLSQPRAFLAGEIQKLRPELTNKKMLMYFTKQKLVRMLYEAGYVEPARRERAG